MSSAGSGGITASAGASVAESGSAAAGAPATAGAAPTSAGGSSGHVETAGGGSANGGLSGGGSSAAGAGGDTAPAAFSCNLVIGNSTTQQWFDGGFLTDAGIDGTRWELFYVAHHYLDSWADPSDPGWSTAFDLGHACESDSLAPESVIFIATFAPPYPSEATYQADLTSIAANIKAKYQTVKRIELMTLVRSPGNGDTACSSATSNEQAIPAAEDQAIAAVAADPAFAGLVVASPPFYVTACSDFLADQPQYTTAGATNIARVYSAYYALHP